jgi:hypothetical protein
MGRTTATRIRRGWRNACRPLGDRSTRSGLAGCWSSPAGLRLRAHRCRSGCRRRRGCGDLSGGLRPGGPLRRCRGLPLSGSLPCRLRTNRRRRGTGDRAVEGEIAKLRRSDDVVARLRARRLLRRVLGKRRPSRDKHAGRSRDNDPQARRHDPQAID